MLFLAVAIDFVPLAYTTLFRSLPIGTFYSPITFFAYLYCLRGKKKNRSGCCNIDENRIEQCFAAHIVHSCQQY
jgi:hypothetical protein